MIKKILRYIATIPNIPLTIWFNFHYLPFKQALYMPIWLYNPANVIYSLLFGTGEVSINSNVKPGLIRMGQKRVSIFSDKGIMWENNGKVIFNGRCSIGSGSSISVAQSGRLSLGENFTSHAGLKIVCYNSITFGSECLIGWNNLFMDTDLHLIKSDNGESLCAYAPIVIGSNNWFAMDCVILKGSTVPPSCIAATRTIFNKDYSSEKEHTLFAGQPAKSIKTGVYHDYFDDKILYQN